MRRLASGPRSAGMLCMRLQAPLHFLHGAVAKRPAQYIQYDARDKFPSRVVGGGMTGESVAT